MPIATLLGRFVNNTTMYRLMLYYLLAIHAAVVFLSVTGALPYDPVNFVLQSTVLVGASKIANMFFAKLSRAKQNLESDGITALILALIVGPFDTTQNLGFLITLSVLAMASKYAMVAHRKHIFNPAALAVLASGLILGKGASWWAGNQQLLPVIVIGGIIVLAKTKRVPLFTGFVLVYVFSHILFGGAISAYLLPPAMWFFVFVMLIEPLTSPSLRNSQIAFGAIVAAAYISLPRVIPGFSYGLETSLLIGNVFAHLVSTVANTPMVFVKKQMAAKDTWSLSFKPEGVFHFIPGQYFEWTLPHSKFDARGFRRYFTIVSAPEEKLVTIAAKFAEKGSSFKKAMLNLKSGDRMMASGPYGDFTLPQSESQKLCFIAGGIGVTPFASMIGHLISKGQKRDIVLLYSNKTVQDIAFKKLFDSAKHLGINVLYVNTEKDGYIDKKTIKEVRDYKDRTFYISGPSAMVHSFKSMLRELGVKNIKTDFFPGY